MNSKINISEMDKWGDFEWQSYFQERHQLMKSARDSLMWNKWNNVDKAADRVSRYDNNGFLNVNVPLEQMLLEMHMGRTDGRMDYDIVADGQADIKELYPTKYAMRHFLDGVGTESFWTENQIFRRLRAKYGTGIFYTGIRKKIDFRYEPDGDIESDTDLLDVNKLKRIKNEEWLFFPKAIHPRDFYIDDAAVGQQNLQYAQDCIYKEKVSIIEFNNRYSESKVFKNVENISSFVDIDPRNNNDQSIAPNEVVLYHYFHRVTKRYLIVANLDKLIYNGIYLYNDGCLPFASAQFYSRDDRFWGEGIHDRVGWLSAYKSEMFNDIFSAAQINSGMHIIVGNDEAIGQDWEVGGRQLNIWRTTGGAERIQQINPAPNTTQIYNVLNVIDKEIAVMSGINPLDQFDPGSDKVGIVEIMEANKSIRNRSVDENYNMALDEALTMMLSRIKQFAPSLLSAKIKDSKGKILKTIFPKIKISGFKVYKKDGETVYEESLGKYGYFELKSDTLQGVGVKVTTPSTNNLLPILERQKVSEYMNNILSLAQIAQMDQSGESMKKLVSSAPMDDLIDWMSDAYGYDRSGLRTDSEKDKIRKQNLKKLDALKRLSELPMPTQDEVTGMVAQSANKSPSGEPFLTPVEGGGEGTVPTDGQTQSLL